jgi:hypothetical protein
MKIFKEAAIVVILLYLFIAAFVIGVQGDTIEAQRRLIKEMIKNPQCLVPEGK